MAITLQQYNTINVPANTPTQLVAPTTGHYYIQMLNNGPGSVQISQSGAMTSYFTLNPNLSVTPFVWGPDGIWVSAPAAVTLAVALISNTGTGAPTGAGALTTASGQTPWIQNINAATYTLTNVGSLSCNGNIWANAMIANAPAGAQAYYYCYTSSNPRWLFGRTGTAESGANVGSDYVIYRYSDAGAQLTFPFFIKRSNGFIGINGQAAPAYALDVIGDIKGSAGLHLTGLPRGTTLPGGLVAGDCWADTSTTPPTVRIV